jgi:hypothetical protein
MAYKTSEICFDILNVFAMWALYFIHKLFTKFFSKNVDVAHLCPY